MGDRRQVHFKNENIWLYTHWTGTTLPLQVQAALKRGKDRWSDPPYFIRIIFSEMIKDEVMSDIGFGIYNSYQDSNHDDIVIDITKQTISIGTSIYTFEEYLNENFEV